MLLKCPVSGFSFFVKSGLLNFKIGHDSTLPTPCPSRLKELIDLANLDPNGETRPYLQAIARAFRAKRQKKSAPKTLEILLSQPLSISTADGAVTAPMHELLLALNQIEPPSNIGLIRECPKCLELFWAGRKDKEACVRHADALRKQAKRLNVKQRKVERDKKLARLKGKRVRFSELSNTAWLCLVAIMNQQRMFYTIDNWVAGELKKQRLQPPSRKVVRDCLNMLVKRDLLTFHPDDPDDPDESPNPNRDRWAAKQSVVNRMLKIRRKQEEKRQAQLAAKATNKPPTH